ncbi:hypothetical protein ACIBVL_08330 [Streptomyces sp. NPDC049687]
MTQPTTARVSAVGTHDIRSSARYICPGGTSWAADLAERKEKAA